MRCIFCKAATSELEPREHIVPESLGNSDHLLRRGVVCGKCNNYFASKVEKRFLELPEIVALRSNQAVPNKRGVVPANRGMLFPGGELIESISDFDTRELTICFSEEAIRAALKNGNGKMILPFPAMLKPSPIVSRFVGKVAFEALAARFECNDDWLSELVDNPQLDQLRRHTRYGEVTDWPVAIRRIYSVNALWVGDTDETYQILHEFDFLKLADGEIYFALAIFGQEFVINLGGPCLDGWKRWLSKNGHASPLHHGKNTGLERQI